MKKQALLLGGAVVVLAALAALLFTMRDSGGDKQNAGAPRSDTKTPRDRPVTHAPPPDHPGDPVASGDTPEAPATPWTGPTDADGNPVRDHRGDGQVSQHPNPISGESVAAVRTAVGPLVKECAAPLRTADPPQKGKLMVTFTAKAVGGRVFVSNSTVRLTDVDSAELSACVKKAFDAVAVDSPGQIDGERAIALQFTVP